MHVLLLLTLFIALSDSSPTENFHKVPSECLAWPYRQAGIEAQIKELNPDIICLQEVDHFEDNTAPLLKSMGYAGLFHPKIDSPCLRNPRNSGPDGIAIFFKENKYKMVKNSSHLLKTETGQPRNPFLAIALERVGSGKSLFVATLHLKAKKGFEEMRLAQSRDALSYIGEYTKDIDHFVLCGDFNGIPEEPFYSALKESNFLDSAYHTLLGSEPEFTTCKIRSDIVYKHTIDYMWYSKKSLAVKSILLPMEEDQIPAEKFPSLNHPSDHIALCSDFQYL